MHRIHAAPVLCALHTPPTCAAVYSLHANKTRFESRRRSKARSNVSLLNGCNFFFFLISEIINGLWELEISNGAIWVGWHRRIVGESCWALVSTIVWPHFWRGWIRIFLPVTTSAVLLCDFTIHGHGAKTALLSNFNFTNWRSSCITQNRNLLSYEECFNLREILLVNDYSSYLFKRNMDYCLYVLLKLYCVRQSQTDRIPNSSAIVPGYKLCEMFFLW